VGASPVSLTMTTRYEDVWSATQLANLTASPNFATNSSLTMHLTVSSTCDVALEFGFANNGGFLKITVPPNANNLPIVVTDSITVGVPDHSDGHRYELRTDPAGCSGGAANITFSDVKLAFGRLPCDSWNASPGRLGESSENTTAAAISSLSAHQLDCDAGSVLQSFVLTGEGCGVGAYRYKYSCAMLAVPDFPTSAPTTMPLTALMGTQTTSGDKANPQLVLQGLQEPFTVKLTTTPTATPSSSSVFTGATVTLGTGNTTMEYAGAGCCRAQGTQATAHSSIATPEACQLSCLQDADCIAADYFANSASTTSPRCHTYAGSGENFAVECPTDPTTCWRKRIEGYELALGVSDDKGLVFEHVEMLSWAVNEPTPCKLRNEVTTSTLPTGMDMYTLEAEIRVPVADGQTTANPNGAIMSWGEFNDLRVNALRTEGAQGVVNYWWGQGNDLEASTASTASYAGVNLFDGAWHHVMASFDGTIRTIYVDGVAVQSDAPVGHAVTLTTNFCVGSAHTGEAFVGDMRNIRVWNRAPTVASTGAMTGACRAPTCYSSQLALAQSGQVLRVAAGWMAGLSQSLTIEKNSGWLKVSLGNGTQLLQLTSASLPTTHLYVNTGPGVTLEWGWESVQTVEMCRHMCDLAPACGGFEWKNGSCYTYDGCHSVQADSSYANSLVFSKGTVPTKPAVSGVCSKATLTPYAKAMCRSKAGLVGYGSGP